MDCSGPVGMLSVPGPCNRAQIKITCCLVAALSRDFSYSLLMGKSPKHLSVHFAGLFPVRGQISGTQESLRSAMKSVQVGNKKADSSLLPTLL